MKEMMISHQFDTWWAERHLADSFQSQDSPELLRILHNSKPVHDLKNLARELFEKQPEKKAKA